MKSIFWHILCDSIVYRAGILLILRMVGIFIRIAWPFLEKFEVGQFAWTVCLALLSIAPAWSPPTSCPEKCQIVNKFWNAVWSSVTIGSVSDILHCGTCGCGGIEFSTYPLIFAILSVIGQPNLLFQIRECFSLDAIDYLNRADTAGDSSLVMKIPIIMRRDKLAKTPWWVHWIQLQELLHKFCRNVLRWREEVHTYLIGRSAEKCKLHINLSSYSLVFLFDLGILHKWHF